MVRTIVVPILAAILLAACSPRQSQIATAIEHAWKDHPEDMAIATGLIAAADREGASATMGMAARRARDLGRAYGGNMGGQILGGVIAAGSSLVRSTGLSDTAAVDDRLQLNMATGWSVRDLAILDKRRSGDAYIVRVRYSIYANTAQGLSRILLNTEQTLRLIDTDQGWSIDRNGAG